MPWMILLLSLLVSACGFNPQDVGRAPSMTPVGTGLTPDIDPSSVALIARNGRSPSRSLFENTRGDLFRDLRASQIGDVVTVNIAINDRAKLGNSTDRSLESKIDNNMEMDIGFPHYTAKPSLHGIVDSKSSTQGEGNIDRSEKIQVSIAATVVGVLPNGNLIISGNQEVRVNYELRLLGIAGIVRPKDIAGDNTISYDKIAEARISYGGRGRLSEVQQPGAIHQIYDGLKPF